MAQLRLAPAPAAAAPVSLGVANASGRCIAACTADGRLYLLDLQPGARAADADTFALTLMADGLPPRLLEQPWAALALLPPASGGGLLCAQAGSGRLLWCQHPVAALELGQPGAEAFLLGCHQDPITAISVSRCGSFALTADAGGTLRLWGLADGSELATAWGGSGSGPVSAACFLPDGAVATARGVLVSVWRLQQGAACRLELAAELAAGIGSGSAGTFTALAAGHHLLAAGCSDGTTLLWRQSSRGEWQQQLALAATDGVPTTTLAFSSDASLLASAAGPTVSVWCAASGQLLARQALPTAPVTLLWTAGEQLLALMPGGVLQPLGAPQPKQQEADLEMTAAASAIAVSSGAAAGAPAAAAAPLEKQKKCVRFAQASEMASPPALLLARLPGPRAPPPPPLPSHPLLHTHSAGGSRSGSPARSPARKPATPTRDSRYASTTLTAATTAAAMATRHPSEVKPLYPILDLRALRGLQAAAPTPAAPAASTPGCSTEQTAQPQKPEHKTSSSSAGAGSASCSGTCTETAGPDLGSLQGRGHQPAAAEVPQLSATAAAAPALMPTDADAEAQPRRPRLPAPMRRQPSPPPSPSRGSRQRCDACAVAAGEAGSSRPASPGREALLAQLAALRGEAAAAAAEAGKQPMPGAAAGTPGAPGNAAGHEARSSRPVSPIKLGVACTRTAQEQGELQSAEVQAHAVLELDASLPLPAARRQRFARLSRRCTFAGLPTGEPSAAAAGQEPQEPKQEQQEQQQQQASGEGHSCTVFPAAPPAEATGDAAAISKRPASAGGSEGAAAPGAHAVAGQQAAGTAAALPALPGDGFAVGSDAELASDVEEDICEGQGQQELTSTGALGGGCSSLLQAALGQLPAVASVEAASEASSGSLAEATAVRPRPVQPLAGRQMPQALAGAPAVASAAGEAESRSASSLGQVAGMLCQLDSRLSSLAARARLQQQGGLDTVLPGAPQHPVAVAALAAPASYAAPGAELRQAPPPERPAVSEPAQIASQPASYLAAPALNSSLLRIQRAALLQQQAAAAAAAPPPLPEEQARAARQRAATAATTLPPGARLFGPLPPPDAPPTIKLSPSKQAALTGAKKRLDERWVAEHEELQPRLEQLWPPPWQRSAPAPLPLPPLAVPLPDGRQLAADFLGLRL